MPGVVLRMEVEGGGVIRELGRGFNAARKAALHKTAEHWHETMLRPHFGPANKSRFAHEPRSQFYTDIIKKAEGRGQGRFVDNVLKGVSMRFMQAFYSISGSKDQQTVTMRPPGYFARPFIGSFVRDGVTKRITRQPDKPREVTTVDARDNAALSEFCAKEMALGIEAEAARRAARTRDSLGRFTKS